MKKKKYNDDSDKFSDWTTKKLKQWALELDESIYGESACYGRSDLMNLSGVLQALEDRGVQMKSRSYFD